MNSFTLRKPLVVKGKGIHDGKEALMRVAPASSPAILFTVRQPHKSVTIPLSLSAAREAERYTGISKRGVALKTVEHFLSACYGLRLTGLKVEVEGTELPCGEGSAWFFAQLFLKAGRRKIGATRERRITHPFSVKRRKSRIIAYPFPRLRILFFFFPPYPEHPLQSFDFVFSEKRYLREIAPARTFCTYKEIQQLRREGLGQGGNTENTLVLTRKGYYNKPRFQDEPVRHKILDFIGDIGILGHRIRGFFVCIGSGHALNYALLKQLQKQR